MPLTGAQLKRIHETILAAYTSSKLRRVVRFCMDEELSQIVSDEDFSTQVFELVEWAEKEGRIIELVRCAQDNNPGNGALRALREELENGAPKAPETAPPRITDHAAQLGIEWVTIPAGEFLMGSDKKKDKQALDDETPQHKVYLPEYRIARVPVTVAQFAAFVQATGYVTTAEIAGSAWAWSGETWENVGGVNWRHPRGPNSDVRLKQKHPVTCVSWHDAQAFCDWACVRIPSEAEWEKAARGTDGCSWPWGNEVPDVGHCNFSLNVGDTTPVGTYPNGASPYGVLDMAGNVWEWTRSLWGPDRKSPQYGYPYRAGDGRENPDAPGTVRRALRGGAWVSYEYYVRCTSRIPNCADYRSYTVGFRVVSSDV